MNSLQYWLGGSSDNLENFLLMISKAYVPALKDMEMEIAEPETFPDIGIWHPTAPTMYEDLKEYLNWYDTRKDMTFAKDAPSSASSSSARTSSPATRATTRAW